MQIVVRLTAEGFHRWPDAPLDHLYLASRHRHVFHVQCNKRVTRSDREIEIIDFKRQITAYLNERYGQPMELGPLSCEQLARELVRRFSLSKCEVLEDGENGAVVGD